MFKELYDSYIECSQNKSNTQNALVFAIQKEKNLMALIYDLQKSTYKVWKSIYFIITYPKVREVFAGDFRDRVVHHFFIRSIEKNFYKDLTPSAYSCIKNRWTHRCIEDIKSIYWDYKYYLQIDIKSFFMSIDKHILKQKVTRYLPKNDREHINSKNIDFDVGIYSYILDIILQNNPTTHCIYKWDKNVKKLLPPHKSLFNCKDWVGLPIWNYTSQFFANVYLNDLDKYILQELWVKHYYRYVDDLVLFWNDYKKLTSYRDMINNYLKRELNMELVWDKTHLKQTSHWLDFLGYFIKLHVVYTRKRVKNTFLKKINMLQDTVIHYHNYDSIKFKIINFDTQETLSFMSCVSSYIWHMKHCNAKNLLKRFYFKNSFLKYYFDKSYQKQKYLKSKKFKNNYTWYKYFEYLYKNTILFYKIGTYYVFMKKYLYLLSLGPWFKFDFIKIYDNIWFKIDIKYYKLCILHVLKYTDKNILLLDRLWDKLFIKQLFIKQ